MYIRRRPRPAMVVYWWDYDAPYHAGEHLLDTTHIPAGTWVTLTVNEEPFPGEADRLYRPPGPNDPWLRWSLERTADRGQPGDLGREGAAAGYWEEHIRRYDRYLAERGLGWPGGNSFARRASGRPGAVHELFGVTLVSQVLCVSGQGAGAVTTWVYVLASAVAFRVSQVLYTVTGAAVVVADRTGLAAIRLVDEASRVVFVTAEALVMLVERTSRAAAGLAEDVFWEAGTASRDLRSYGVDVVKALETLFIMYLVVKFSLLARPAIRCPSRGDRARLGLTPSSPACVAGDGPSRGLSSSAGSSQPTPLARAASARAPPPLARERGTERRRSLRGNALVELQTYASGTFRAMEEAYPDVARRGRDLAALCPLRAAREVDGGVGLMVQGSRDQVYEVRIRLAAPDGVSCSCPDYVVRGRPCKHILGSCYALLSLDHGALLFDDSEPEVTQPAGSGDGAFGRASLLRELRASEAEVARLQGLLAAAEGRAAAPAAGSQHPGIRGLSGAETEREWARLSAVAKEFICVACFTFDSSAAVLSLEQARARGITVKLVFSAQDKSLTRNQAPRLQRLRACGCEIRAHRPGRLHAKVFLSDAGSVVGSTNFTEASQQNTERGVLIPAELEEFQRIEREWFEKVFSLSPKFLDGLGEAIPASPQR